VALEKPCSHKHRTLEVLKEMGIIFPRNIVKTETLITSFHCLCCASEDYMQVDQSTGRASDDVESTGVDLRIRTTSDYSWWLFLFFLT